MTHEDDVLRERLLTMISESTPAVTADQALARSRSGGKKPARQTMRATRSRRGRPALTIGWVVGIVALAAAAISGLAVANQSPSKISALHLHGTGRSQTSVSTATTSSGSKNHHSQVPPPTATTVRAATHGPALEIFDVTWINVNDGWALVNEAGCASVCPELVITASGGETWRKVTSLPPGTCSSEQCGITFVNQDDGYVFDTETGYLITTDGGSTWTQEAGRAVLSVEPFGSEVLRVSYSHTGCPGPCDITVDEALPGSTTWDTLTPSQQGDRAQLVTEGADDAYLALFQNPAGGAGSAHATLLVTTDAGRTWSTVSDPCGTVNGDEYDTSAIAAAPGPELFVLCTDRVGESSQFLDRSSDPSQGFDSEPMLPGGPFDQIAAASATDVVLGTGPVDYYVGPTAPHTYELIDSTDGGSNWKTVATDRGTVVQESGVAGPTGFLGFESEQLGWWVGDPGYIWATPDGGSQWVRSEISISS